MFRDTYDRAYSSYLPSPNERLEDRPTKLARAEVYLIFLVKKSYKLNGKSTWGGHRALVLGIYVSPKIGIFKKNGAKNLNFFTFTIGYEQ
jgi:hypothetical protein